MKMLGNKADISSRHLLEIKFKFWDFSYFGAFLYFNKETHWKMMTNWNNFDKETNKAFLD